MKHIFSTENSNFFLYFCVFALIPYEHIRNHTSSQNSGPSGAPSNVAPRPTTNAWVVPLQQNRIRASSDRPKVTSAPPGLTKSSNPYSAPTPVQNNLRDRFLHLNQLLVGQRVTVTLISGDILEGILHTFSPFKEGANKNKYVIKACTYIKSSQPMEEGRTVILKCEDVRDVLVKSLRFEGSAHKSNSNSLVTDTDISARGSNGTQNGNGRHKDGLDDLITAGSAWMNGASDNGVSLSSRAEVLKSGGSSGLNGNIGQWDQFSENEKLFNVRATFDEDVYTTSLDRKSLDASQIEKAEKMAKEIEGTASSNIHIAEERGQKIETDFDEEDLYSGVLRKSAKGTSSSSSGVWGKKGAIVEAEKKKREEEKKESFPPPPIKKNYAAVAAAAVKPAKPKPIPVKETTEPATSESVSKEKTDKVAATSSGPSVDKEENKAMEGKDKSEETEGSKEKETVNVQDSASTKNKIDETETSKASTKKDSKESAASESDKEKEGADAKPSKPVSKLNANAKSFSFNPSAKAFTPGAAKQQQQPAAVMQSGVDDSYGGGMVGYTPHHPYMSHVQPGKKNLFESISSVESFFL